MGITHSYTTTRRAGTTQTTVTTKVALVDGTTAKKSVANLEQSTGNGNFDKTWKTLAAQQGVTLGDAVSSGKIEGTSSATMVVPKKYQATQHESSSSSSEKAGRSRRSASWRSSAWPLCPYSSPSPCSTRRRSPTFRTALPTPTPPGTKPVPTPKLKLLSRPTPPSRPPRLLTPGAPAPTAL